MVDLAKATKTLEDYFADVTKEQFSEDLRKFCPELFEEDEDRSNGNGNEDISLCGEYHRSPSTVRQLDLTAHSDEIYQQAKQDSKIEIAAKLLHRGISVKEVAEILELDISSIA